MWLIYKISILLGELQKCRVIFGCDNKQHHLPDSSHFFSLLGNLLTRTLGRRLKPNKQFHAFLSIVWDCLSAFQCFHGDPCNCKLVLMVTMFGTVCVL